MRQYKALVSRYELAQDRQDYRAGMLVATLVNVNRAKDSDPSRTPWDFFTLKQLPRPKAAEQGRQSWQEQLQFVKLFTMTRKHEAAKSGKKSQ